MKKPVAVSSRVPVTKVCFLKKSVMETPGKGNYYKYIMKKEKIVWEDKKENQKMAARMP